MKAALLKGPDRLDVTRVADPVCPAGGVLVKIRACGICGADAKMIASGHRALVYPRIPGHEIAGVVVDSRNGRFRENDRVQVAPGMRCGRCRTCAAGRDNQCVERQILGFTTDGGFAEYLAVPLAGNVAGAVQPIPDGVSAAEACLAEPLACCLNALDKLGPVAGDRVLIIGGGPLGCLHAAAASHGGAARILVSEILGHRRTAAAGFGADRVIDPLAENLYDAVMAETGGQGVDAVVLACAGTAVDDGLLRLMAPGGRLSVFSGISPAAAGIPLDMNTVHYREIRLAGSYGCTADQNGRALEIIASGRFPIDGLITHRTSLENIAAGIAHTRSQKALKSIMEVNHG